MSKIKIVVSGINMVEGGIFTILDNCLQNFEYYNRNFDYEIIALVPDSSKFDYRNISFIEFPKSKKYWVLRFYYEYFYFKKLSKKLKADLWLSLHDMTPNVACKKQFVYCHNPNMFYKPTLKECFFDYKVGVFGLFYKYLYQINIKKNVAVFVQQQWIKTHFQSVFDINNVVVNHPIMNFDSDLTSNNIVLDAKKVHFFYPSFPRTFKNFEIIFRAIDLLETEVLEKICFHLTIDKNTTNLYVKYLLKSCRNTKVINFTGILSKKMINGYYAKVDCLVFPSKLETWGLPISEIKNFGKPMLLANLPYAFETAGNYDNVSFFDVDSARELADLMSDFVNQTIDYDGNVATNSNDKILEGWSELVDFMLKK